MADPLPDIVMVQLNFDSKTLFRSPNGQLWSILGRATQPSWTPVFVVGFYCVKGKSFSVSDCLNECTSELNASLWNSIKMAPKRLGALCPLRSVIQSHRPSSEKWSDRRATSAVIVPINGDIIAISALLSSTLNSQLDTENNFTSRGTTKTTLALVPVPLLTDMTSTFPFDFVHPVCSSVIQILLALRLHGHVTNCLCLRRSAVQTLVKRILAWDGSMPCDFQRLYWKVDDVDWWKAMTQMFERIAPR